MQNSSHLGTNIVDSLYIHLHWNTDPVDKCMCNVKCQCTGSSTSRYSLHFTSAVIPSPGSCYRAGRQWQGRGVISEAVGAAADCERLGLQMKCNLIIYKQRSGITLIVNITDPRQISRYLDLGEPNISRVTMSYVVTGAASPLHSAISVCYDERII